MKVVYVSQKNPKLSWTQTRVAGPGLARGLQFPRYCLHKIQACIQDFTWDMTSSDQLSVIVIGWVGLAGILLSFSEGLSSVGPKTVARLCRDILLMLSLSATLEEETMNKADLYKYPCSEVTLSKKPSLFFLWKVLDTFNQPLSPYVPKWTLCTGNTLIWHTTVLMHSTDMA